MSKLPKLNTPTFSLTIPSTKTKIDYRPFLVKEEKVLLMAAESAKQKNNKEDVAKEILKAMKNVIQNCILTDNIKIDNLASFDLEYMFLKIRSKSVGELAEINYINQNCKREKLKDEEVCIVKFAINLNEIEITEDPAHVNKIMLTDTIGITLKEPSTDVIVESAQQPSEMDSTFYLVSKCIDKIFTNDEVYLAKDSSEEEMKEFIESLSSQQLSNIMDFFKTSPRLKHECVKKCGKCGDDVKITLEGIQDFFE